MATSQIVDRVQPLGHAFPTEDPQTQESRLEEKGQQRLDRQRGSEDVAYKAGIPCPVHAKLEFHHDAGDHPHGKVDQEELPPELRQALVEFIPPADIDRLQDHDEPGQPQRQGNEKEMVDGGQRKLHARQDDR